MEDELSEISLVAWLNSSLGPLTLLAERTTTEGSWVALEKQEVASLPVLDVSSLLDNRRKQISQLFDDLSESEFQRLPAMVDCPARRALDDGPSEILGPPNLEVLRRLLSSEPVISNRRP